MLQKLIWTFTVWIDCSCDLKIFGKIYPIAKTIFSHSRSKQFWKQNMCHICFDFWKFQSVALVIFFTLMLWMFCAQIIFMYLNGLHVHIMFLEKLCWYYETIVVMIKDLGPVTTRFSTQYVSYSCIIYLIKMEYVSKLQFLV